MKERLEEISKMTKEKVEQITTSQELKELKAKVLGKKSELTEILRGMGQIAAEQRPVVGELVNKVRTEIEEVIDSKEKEFEEAELKRKVEAEKIDITLPATRIKRGSIHPLNRIIEDVEDLFVSMGYDVVTGPELETDEYCFERLNLPKDHPARDMQDTFYITEDMLLRSQTSSVQVRTMLANTEKTPIKMICPGKVYRRDDDDATHSHQFMQIEGLLVDKNISLSDLKGTIDVIVKKLFGEKVETRFRPSYYQFTEPSVEVDVSCSRCGGKGCPTCKGVGWIEVLGAGMVNDNVLRMSGYDPEHIQGFAFGVGIERVAMLKYGIDDIRNFYTNDLRFLHQFKEVK